MLVTETLTAAERVTARRNRRTADVSELIAASALRSLTAADALTADAAADAIAASIVRDITAAERPDVGEALAAAVREKDGRRANGRRTAERADAMERESQGYAVPRESMGESIARLVSQRYGPRAAFAVLTAATATDAPRTLAHRNADIRAALGFVLDPVAANHAAAFVAALLADGPTLKRDHDAATCVQPACFRCTAALNKQGKRASTPPIRPIGEVGPLTAPRAKGSKKKGEHRPTAHAPREHSTPRAIHLLREQSTVAALDLSREHHASTVGADPADVGDASSPLVVAALLSLTSANGRGERADVAERVAALPRVAAEQVDAWCQESTAAEHAAERAAWAAWWASRASTAAERADARGERDYGRRITAEHRRRAALHARAALAAEQEHAARIDPQALTAAAAAVALHALRPGKRARRAAAASPVLAHALAAVERADAPPVSRRASAFTTWAAHRSTLTAAARRAVERADVAEQEHRHARAAWLTARADVAERADAATLAHAWAIPATFRATRGAGPLYAASASTAEQEHAAAERAAARAERAAVSFLAAHAAARAAVLALAEHHRRRP